MDCKYKLSDMLEFLDGDMKNREAEIFENHFKECNSCQKELVEYNNLVTILQKAYEDPFTCPDMETILAYSADALDDDKMASVRAHIGDCVLCQIDYKRLEDDATEWSRTYAPPKDKELYEKIMARIKKKRLEEKQDPNQRE